MAMTEADVDALKRALASGELEVTYLGRKTVYRSVDDLLKAIAYAEAEVAAASAAGLTTQSVAAHIRE